MSIRTVLKDGAGKVVGVCDSGLGSNFGRWQWIPRARPVPAADLSIEIDAPQMVDLGEVIGATYKRLR